MGQCTKLSTLKVKMRSERPNPSDQEEKLLYLLDEHTDVHQVLFPTTACRGYRTRIRETAPPVRRLDDGAKGNAGESKVDKATGLDMLDVVLQEQR